MTRPLRTTCTLSDAERLAKAQLGQRAPSYPTLRRWAKAGRLDGARVEQGTRRTLYRADLIVATIAELAGDLDDQGAGMEVRTPGMPPSEAAAPASHVGTAELEAKVDSLAAAVANMARHIGDLAEIRKRLMLQADTVASLWKARALSAEAELEKLRGSPLEQARAQRRIPLIDYEGEDPS